MEISKVEKGISIPKVRTNFPDLEIGESFSVTLPLNSKLTTAYARVKVRRHYSKLGHEIVTRALGDRAFRVWRVG